MGSVSTRTILTAGAKANRRLLLRGALGAGAVVVIGARSAFAQETAQTAPGEAVWTKYNLNAATDARFRTIPGVGDQMVREFLEYRPYASIAQFRGELGKYVAPEQVAAYERYVFVPVDPNQADAATLQQLPGVDATIAESLIGGRPFDTVETFLTALGQAVAPEQAAVAAAYLAPAATETATWIKYNLNVATPEQFQTIPGIGERMVDEFREYRPYASIAQFRGEIGKYVEPEEVTAFEAYLFVPVDPNQADVETLKQLPGVDDERAGRLTAGRPFDSLDAFVAALTQVVTPEQAETARGFLATP